MKLLAKDKHGRAAGKLGLLHICPHCEETLTRNKHWDELVLSMLVVFLPAFIGIFGYASGSNILLLIALLILLTASGYGFYLYRIRLKGWPRWITFREFQEQQTRE